MNRRLRASQAFTLIELLVVLLIIGILIAVAAPSFLGQTNKAHESAAKQNNAAAYKAAKAYAVDGRDANGVDVPPAGHSQGSFDGFTTAVLQGFEPGLSNTTIVSAGGGDLEVETTRSGITCTLTVTAGVLAAQGCAPAAAPVAGGIIGKDTPGALEPSGFGAEQNTVTKFTLPAGSYSFEKLTARLANATGETRNVVGVIYADNAGIPGALLGTTSAVALPDGSALDWVDLPFAAPVVISGGVDVWFGFLDGGASMAAGVAASLDLSGGALTVTADAYGDGPADPFAYDPDNGVAPWVLAIYGTYS